MHTSNTCSFTYYFMSRHCHLKQLSPIVGQAYSKASCAEVQTDSLSATTYNLFCKTKMDNILQQTGEGKALF